MSLTPFVEPPHLPTVAAYSGALLQLYSAILVVPLLVALLFQEFDSALRFVGIAAGALLLGWLLRRFQAGEIGVRESLVVTTLAYLSFSLLGGLLFLPQADYVDGFFEAMSGFTTTGLSVMSVDSLPQSLLFFRAYSQWIGGAGIVILSVVLLISPGRESLRLFSSEAHENLVGDTVDSGRIVIRIYGFMTGAGFLSFLLCGVPAFDALLHAFTTVSTGGFSSHAESMGHYDNLFLRVATVLFMLAGAAGFPLYHRAWKEGPKVFLRSSQFRYLLGFPVVLYLLLMIADATGQPSGLPTLFHLFSASTTTGFSVTNTTGWTVPTQAIVIFLMMVGASTGSTAGGIKIVRFLVVIKSAGWLVFRALLPKEARIPIKIDGDAISDHEIKEISGLLALFFLLALLSTLGLALHGYSFADSVFETVSALGTVGLSAGVTSGDLAVSAKLILIVDMWAGRLEILPIVLLFYLSGVTTLRKMEES